MEWKFEWNGVIISITLIGWAMFCCGNGMILAEINTIILKIMKVIIKQEIKYVFSRYQTWYQRKPYQIRGIKHDFGWI